MKQLSPSAQKVQDVLRQRGFGHLEVLEHARSTRTAQEAADAVGTSVGQIVKSLIFKGAQSGKPYLLLVSGPNRVHEAKVAEVIGEPLERADPDFVREVTGFAIGGFPRWGTPRGSRPSSTRTCCNTRTSGLPPGRPRPCFALRRMSCCGSPGAASCR